MIDILLDITIQYYVLLYSTIDYYILLCITTYYYLLLDMTRWCSILLCITLYNCIFLFDTVWYTLIDMFQQLYLCSMCIYMYIYIYDNNDLVIYSFWLMTIYLLMVNSLLMVKTLRSMHQWSSLLMPFHFVMISHSYYI